MGSSSSPEPVIEQQILRDQGLVLHDTPDLSGVVDELGFEETKNGKLDELDDQQLLTNGDTYSIPEELVDPLDESNNIGDLNPGENGVDGVDIDVNVDDEDDDFEFLQMLTRESFQHNVNRLLNEKSLQSADGEAVTDFEPNEILGKYYKYWSLDELTSSFKRLLNEIDTELINLVNNEYSDFIDLGKSIDGSEEIIKNIKIDIQSYMKDLKLFNVKIDNDETKINNLFAFKKSLNFLKKIIDYLLVLNEQTEYVENLLHISTDNSTVVPSSTTTTSNSQKSFDNIDEMTVIYLSIHKILVKLNKYIMNNKELAAGGLNIENIEMLNSLNRRITGLRIEFKSLLDDYLKTCKDKDELFKLFKIYQFINESSSFKKIIKNKD